MALIDLANAVAHVEDSSWNPASMNWSIPNANSLAQKNNNPGNLRFNPAHPEYTPGAVMGAGGMARYPSIADGFAAIERQAQIDAGRNMSLAAFIAKWAPPNENNTSSYINTVATNLQVSSQTSLTDIIGNPRKPLTLAKIPHKIRRIAA